MYEILITMNSQRCWIVNIRAKILIVKRFFMKSAKYCNSWLAIHGFWYTAYWMGSMCRYQCCHYSVFFNMVFFLYSTFLFGCYITKLLCDQILNISIVVCVVMVMMKLQFFLFWHSCIPYFIYKMRIDKKKKKKRK